MHSHVQTTGRRAALSYQPPVALVLFDNAGLTRGLSTRVYIDNSARAGNTLSDRYLVSTAFYSK